MLSFNTGSPRMPLAVVQSGFKAMAKANPLDMGENVTKHEDLPKSMPIKAVHFKVTATVTVASGNVTEDANGFFNMFDRVKIIRNNVDEIVDIKGFMIPAINRQYFGKTPDVFVEGTGNTNVVACFSIPFDLGSYRSLLDASRDKSLRFELTTGDVADGLDGTTLALTNLRIQATVEAVQGIPAGMPGGLEDVSDPDGFRYLRTFLRYQSKARADSMTLELSPGRGYHGLTLFERIDGVLTDDVIDSMKLTRNGGTFAHFDIDDYLETHLREQRYGLDSDDDDFTGIFEVPLVDPGHLEHTVSIPDNQDLDVELDTTTASGTLEEIYLLEHYVRTG